MVRLTIGIDWRRASRFRHFFECQSKAIQYRLPVVSGLGEDESLLNTELCYPIKSAEVRFKMDLSSADQLLLNFHHYLVTLSLGDQCKAFIEGKRKIEKDLLSKILYEKLFDTLKQPGGIRANISQ